VRRDFLPRSSKKNPRQSARKLQVQIRTGRSASGLRKHGDRGEDWLGPDAVWKRVEWATRVADRAGRAVDARRLAAESFGPRLGAETARQIERAADGSQALALLLLAPEFQRR